MILWPVYDECTDVIEFRRETCRDGYAVVWPLMGAMDGAGDHTGDGGGSWSKMKEDLCRPNRCSRTLLGVAVPFVGGARPSKDDRELSVLLSLYGFIMM
jgi:hypothetical protein